MGFRERLGQMRVSRRETAFPHPSIATGERIHLVAALVAVTCVLFAVVQAYLFQTRHGLAQIETSGPAAFPLLSAVTLSLLTIAVVIIRPGRLQPVRLVQTSAVWTAVLLIALVCTWLLVDREVRAVEGVGQTVTSRADVDRYLAAHALELTDQAVAPIQIPTGIFVETIEFSNANDVQISAFIWQRYGPRVPADIPRGFSLPGAVSERTDALDSYTVTDDDGSTLLGWHAHLIVRQPLNYRDFPLDRHDISLRLWPEVPDRRVVLVPDLASYANLAPEALPGLSEDFVGGGWIAEHTFFSFDMNDDNAMFGFPEGATPRGFPELVFNVGLKRSFVEPFINDVLLTIVVSLLLFAIVILNAQDMDRRTRFGITTFGVLGTSGTLLFTVLTKHNQIRSDVTPGQIVYIEILPMLLYITILLVAANAILLLAVPADRAPLLCRFLSYEDNLLPSVVYWPALLGTLLVVTLLMFSR